MVKQYNLLTTLKNRFGKSCSQRVNVHGGFKMYQEIIIVWNRKEYRYTKPNTLDLVLLGKI
jgi:hypothetical protein